MGTGGSKPTLKEEIRENTRMLDRAIRELDRERTRLEREKRSLEAALRKSASTGENTALKMQARDYVRSKAAITKLYGMRTQLSSLKSRLATMQSFDAMVTAMTGASQAMMRMNARLQLPNIQRIMQEFGLQSERMEATQEMMGDAMDDAMSDDEAAEEEVINSVLGELNIQMAETVPSAPTGMALGSAATAGQVDPGRQAVAAGGMPPPPSAAAGAPPGDKPGAAGAASGAAPSPGLSDLEARLAALKK